MSLEFQNIHVQMGQKQILRGASVTAAAQQVTGIIGPNGSGKSTLIKTLFALARYQRGNILLEGRDTRQISRRELARRVGYVGQETHCAFHFTVGEVVAMGMFPHQKSGKRTPHLRPASEIVTEALAALGISNLTERNIQTLSGGEKKLVFLARAIAQEVGVIVLDEPTNHLDIKHQLFILDYLKNSGKTVLIVLHDLSLAARYCDRIYLLNQGAVAAAGSPFEVLTLDNVKAVFGVAGYASVNAHGQGGFTLQ